MNRLYFLASISILIIIPQMVNAFFTASLQSITVTRNLTCQMNADGTLGSDFQLCAIRVYYGGDGSTSALYNGMRYVNTFHNLIRTTCPSWPTSDGSVADTGSITCDTKLPFETFVEMQLCICTTNNCNQDWITCFDSVDQGNSYPSLIKLMPDLNSPIQCSDSLNASNTCNESPYINASLCTEYVSNNSVLCAITVNGANTIQTSLIYENYEAVLDENIYQALLKTSGSAPIQTDNSVYYTYSSINAGVIEECACASSSFCNVNIGLCSLQATAANGTTTLSTSSTTTTTAFTDSTTTTLFTDSTTTVTATGSATAIDSATATGSTTAIDSTMAADSATTMSTDSTTTLEPIIVIPSATQPSSFTGESGLGSSATAGIACGIIFSVVIFTAEILYFKFVYSGNNGSGFDRSVYYQA